MSTENSTKRVSVVRAILLVYNGVWYVLIWFL